MALVRVLNVFPVDVRENDMRLIVSISGHSELINVDPLGRFVVRDQIYAAPPNVYAAPLSDQSLDVTCINDQNNVMQQFSRIHFGYQALKIVKRGRSGSVAFFQTYAIKFQRLRSDGTFLCCPAWTELHTLREANRICEIKRLGNWFPKIYQHSFVKDQNHKKGMLIVMDRFEETLYDRCKKGVITPAIIVQIVFALVLLQRHCLFYHNDLHTSNVMLTSNVMHARQHISLEYGMFEFPASTPDVKLIDLGYARFSKIDEGEGVTKGCVSGYGHSCAHEENWSFDLRRVCVQLLHQVVATDPQVVEFLKVFHVDQDSCFFPHTATTPTPHACMSGNVPSFSVLLERFRVKDVRDFSPTLPKHIFVHNSDALYTKQHVRQRFLAREYPDSLVHDPLPQSPTRKRANTKTEIVLNDFALLWYQTTEDCLTRKSVRVGEPFFQGHTEAFAFRYRRYRLRFLRLVCRAVYENQQEHQDIAVLVFAIIYLLFRENPNTFLHLNSSSRSFFCNRNKLNSLGMQLAFKHDQLKQLRDDPHGNALVRVVPNMPIHLIGASEFKQLFLLSASSELYTMNV